MKTIRSTRNGKTAKVSARLAQSLVAGGKYEYETTEMRPEPVTARTPAKKRAKAKPDATEAKPKRQYRRRDMQSQAQE